MPATRFQSQYLSELVSIAKTAGAAIMLHYQKDELEVQMKTDESPVTAADLASHNVIVAALTQLNPDIPILSEESTATDWATRQNWQAYWLIDPLDGTKEFIKGNGEFTVNIAYIEKGIATAGVVYAPAIGKCYSGAIGFGAWLEINQNMLDSNSTIAPKMVQLFARAPHKRSSPIVVGSRSHVSPLLEDYLSNMTDYQMMSVGSSLKFCMLAEGLADIYPRLGPTSEWDTAAAQAVLESAGGQVVQYNDGQPLRYNQKQDILNPFFVATSSQWS